MNLTHITIRTQLIALAGPGGRCEIEEVYLNNRLKVLVGYYGSLAITAGDAVAASSHSVRSAAAAAAVASKEMEVEETGGGGGRHKKRYGDVEELCYD